MTEQNFLENLARYTKADMAAWDDIMGASFPGGDTALEMQVEGVSPGPAFDQRTLDNLGAVTGVTLSDAIKNWSPGVESSSTPGIYRSSDLTITTGNGLPTTNSVMAPGAFAGFDETATFSIITATNEPTNPSNDVALATSEPVRIESHPVYFLGIDTGYDHLYLVFSTLEGEYLIRGGPLVPPAVDPIVVVPGNLLLEDSADARGDDSLADRGSRIIDFGSRSEIDVWEVMKQQAANIGAAELPYELLTQNSNSVIASVLHAVGIDVLSNIPTNTTASTTDLPGISNLLVFNTNLVGGGAADLIQGYRGSDILSGEAGNDTLNGGAANDTLNGGAGNDRLDAGSGIDSMIGGDGSDRYYVRNSGDVVTETNATAAGGIDLVYAYLSSYLLTSNVENGRIMSTGTANLTGNVRNNLLTGEIGDNALTGRSGIDTLIGGGGKDTLTGGAGDDIFDFNAPSEMGTTISTQDVINDFVRGQDKIDLRTLDANPDTATNDAFSGFIASGASFTSAGQLKFSGGVLYGNTDSDSTAEFAMQLVNISTLTASDLFL